MDAIGMENRIASDRTLQKCWALQTPFIGRPTFYTVNHSSRPGSSQIRLPTQNIGNHIFLSCLTAWPDWLMINKVSKIRNQISHLGAEKVGVAFRRFGYPKMVSLRARTVSSSAGYDGCSSSRAGLFQSWCRDHCLDGFWNWQLSMREIPDLKGSCDQKIVGK